MLFRSPERELTAVQMTQVLSCLERAAALLGAANAAVLWNDEE